MDLMIEKLLGFTMVLTRISAFFLVAPVFSWKSIPVRVKAAMTILLSIFFATIMPAPANIKDAAILNAILLLSNEAIYGLALGLIVILIFTSIKLSGRIIERQMGLNMAQILDPLTGESGQPLGMLLETMFIILFLSVNGHHFLLMIISKSYQAFPAGTMPTIDVLTSGIIKAGSTMLIAGLRMAAPILAAFLLLMVTLAVLARIAPEMNILFISLPMRTGLGFIMVIIFLPLINSFIAEFSNLMGKLLPL